MSKRIKLVIAAIILLLCAFGIFYYSEHRTMNFIDTFITNPDEFEQLVNSISITEMNGGTNNTILITTDKDEELYNQIRSTLSNWEVKRTLFKNMDVSNIYYKMDFATENNSMHPLNILISEEGIMNVNGKEFELVKGDLEELLGIVQ